MNIMRQNDRSRLGAAQYPLADHRCSRPLPIERIDGPKYDAEAKLFLNPFSLTFRNSAIRWSHQGWRIATRILNSLLRLSNFLGHSLIRQLGKLRMSPGMVPNFVPFRQSPLRNFGMRNDVGTYHEERHFDVALFQN